MKETIKQKAAFPVSIGLTYLRICSCIDNDVKRTYGQGFKQFLSSLDAMMLCILYEIVARKWTFAHIDNSAMRYANWTKKSCMFA